MQSNMSSVNFDDQTDNAKQPISQEDVAVSIPPNEHEKINADKQDDGKFGNPLNENTSSAMGSLLSANHPEETTMSTDVRKENRSLGQIISSTFEEHAANDSISSHHMKKKKVKTKGRKHKRKHEDTSFRDTHSKKYPIGKTLSTNVRQGSILDYDEDVENNKLGLKICCTMMLHCCVLICVCCPFISGR